MRRGVVHLQLPDIVTDLTTASGVFGAQRVDPGTLTLLRHVPRPAAHTSVVVDLSAGYGPIAVTLARRQPRAGVWAVEINALRWPIGRLPGSTCPGFGWAAASPPRSPRRCSA